MEGTELNLSTPALSLNRGLAAYSTSVNMDPEGQILGEQNLVLRIERFPGASCEPKGLSVLSVVLKQCSMWGWSSQASGSESGPRAALGGCLGDHWALSGVHKPGPWNPCGKVTGQWQQSLMAPVLLSRIFLGSYLQTSRASALLPHSLSHISRQCLMWAICSWSSE